MLPFTVAVTVFACARLEDNVIVPWPFMFVKAGFVLNVLPSPVEASPTEAFCTGLLNWSLTVKLHVEIPPTACKVGLQVNVEFPTVGTPATSVRVPKLVDPETPEMTESPDFVISPDAKGVPAVGRTRTPCHVKLFSTEPSVSSVIVIVIAEEVLEVIGNVLPEATPFRLLASDPQLSVHVTSIVGAVPPVSNSKPVGALRIIVPFPI